MAGSIVEQNKKLSSAASSPRDTSKRKVNADSYSAKIASSKSESKNKINDSSEKVSQVKSEPIRGSYEGLDLSKDAVLNGNNRGYDNAALKTARYSDKDPTRNIDMFSSQNFNNSGKYSIMDNYSSISRRGSSSDRLGKIVKSNMMFG